LQDLLSDVLLEQTDLIQAKKTGLDSPEAAIAKKDNAQKVKKRGAYLGNAANQTFLITYVNW
jgi:hypothetical protein